MAVDKLYQLSRSLHQQKLDPTALIQAAVRGTGAVFDAPHGCIVLVDSEGRLARIALSGTQLDPKVEREFWTKLITSGLVRSVIDRWRPVTIPNISLDTTWPQLERFPTLRWRGSAAAIPLLKGDALIGVLALVHPEVDAFGEKEMVVLLEIGELISDALENAVTFDNMKREHARIVKLTESEQETDQLRHDLTAMIYHDLRAPLHNIHTSLGTLELMIHQKDPVVAEKLLGMAMQSSRRLIRMVKSLLDIDRLEAGRAVLHRKTTTFEALFNDMLTSTRPLAEEMDQELTIASDDVPGVIVDHDMILRVIINLVENAIKHTPPGGRITVGVTTEGTESVIRVRDTGPGIPPTHHDDVFDKYFRIRNTETAKIEEMKIGVPVDETPDVSTRGGVGLGLAFCRLAVEAHGGRIWVEDAPGGGAIFAFALPTEVQPQLEPMMEMN